MKNRLSRFMSQGSEMVLAAMAVGLMSFHGQYSAGNNIGSQQDAKSTVHTVRHVSGTRSGLAGDVTKIDFDPYVDHHPWS